MDPHGAQKGRRPILTRTPPAPHPRANSIAQSLWGSECLQVHDCQMSSSVRSGPPEAGYHLYFVCLCTWLLRMHPNEQLTVSCVC